MRPGVVAQESMVANEVDNLACVNNKVLSATSDSGICVTGIVNQCDLYTTRHWCNC